MSKNRLTQLLWPAACIGVLVAGCGRREAAPAPPPVAAVPQSNAPVANQAHLTSFFEAPYRDRKKMDVFGVIPPTPPTGGEIPVKDFKLISYRTNGDTEIILTAPDCVLSQGDPTNIVTSAGPLHAQTGDGSFIIEGTGFIWQQDESNATLIISNNVVTTVQKALLATGAFASNTPPGATGTNQVVHVFADHFFFDRNASLVTYSGNVRAEDEQLQLRAEVVNLHRATNGTVNNLEADTNVVIVDKATSGRTTGDHAVYSAGEKGAQLVTLTGNPRWQSGDGLSEGTASTFVFDSTANTFQARDRARFRLAATGNTDSSFFLAPRPAATNAPGGAPKFADVDADVITLQLPPAKGPPQRVLAEGHVVIVNEADGSRATTDHATYVPADGALELAGHAQYQSGERLARADVLSLNQKSQSVFARTNALLRFPPSALNQSPAFGAASPGRAGRATNGMVGISADSYDYQNEVLTFHDHVKAAYSEGDVIIGTVDCGSLVVNIHSNAVERIVAEQNVHLHQPPTLDAHGKTAEAELNTQRIEIQMRTNGLVQTVDATGGVTASRTETALPGGKTNRMSLAASTLKALFQAATNQVESVTANGEVRLTDDAMTAQGDKLDYTYTNDTSILTGHPFLLLPGARVNAENGIVYDHAHDIIRAQGRPQTLATVPVTGSNLPGLLSPVGKPSR